MRAAWVFGGSFFSDLSAGVFLFLVDFLFPFLMKEAAADTHTSGGCVGGVAQLGESVVRHE